MFQMFVVNLVYEMLFGHHLLINFNQNLNVHSQRYNDNLNEMQKLKILYLRIKNELQGTFKVTCGSFDLSVLSRIPIDPGKIYVNLTLQDSIKSATNSRMRRELLCIGTVVTITHSKQRSSKREN